MTLRLANPEDLEHLAKLLEGRGGVEDRLDEASPEPPDSG